MTKVAGWIKNFLNPYLTILVLMAVYRPSYSVEASSQARSRFAQLEMEARQIITYHCGGCHTPGLKTSNSRALRVFDLGERENWWKKMRPARLSKSQGMLNNRLSATKAELEENFLNWKFKPRPPSRAELRAYSDFVEAAISMEAAIR